MCDLLDQEDQEDQRELLVFHYAGHGVLIEGDLHLTASLGSRHTLDFELSFGKLYRKSAGFINADVIIVLDCCYSGLMTRALSQEDRSVEIVATVGSTQEANGNASNPLRLEVGTFTSRLADESARVVGNPEKSSVAFSEIVTSMHTVSSPDRLPEYFQRRGTIGISLGIPDKSRIAIQKSMPAKGKESRHTKSSSIGSAPSSSGLMAVFKIARAQKSANLWNGYTRCTQALV